MPRQSRLVDVRPGDVSHTAPYEHARFAEPASSHKWPVCGSGWRALNLTKAAQLRRSAGCGLVLQGSSRVQSLNGFGLWQEAKRRGRGMPLRLRLPARGLRLTHLDLTRHSHRPTSPPLSRLAREAGIRGPPAKTAAAGRGRASRLASRYNAWLSAGLMQGSTLVRRRSSVVG